MNTANWPKKILVPERILLNPKNPRLPELVRDGSQDDIRHYIIKQYKVIKLAKSIARKGYYTHKIPIVTKIKGRYYVLEGNRRIVALSCINNPKLAPLTQRGVFNTLHREIDLNTIQKIEVMIAPSADAAHQLIFSDHAEENSLRWKPIQKARFYVDDLEYGISAKEIANKHSVSVAEVLSEARSFFMYRMAAEFEYPTKIQQIITDEELFKYSTFMRIINNKPFIDNIIATVVDNRLEVKCEKDWFAMILKRIVTDVAKGSPNGVTSRTLNTADQLIAYFNKIIDNKTKPDSNETFTYSPTEGTVKEKPRETEDPKPPKGNTRFYLIPKDFVVAIDNPKLEKLVEEAKKMLPGTMPHAAALLLRAILEMSIYHMYHRSGFSNDIDGNNGQRPGLTKLLNQVASRDDIIKNNQLRRTLLAFTKGDDYQSLETLNLYTHSEYLSPTREQLKEFWTTLKPLLEIALIDK